MQIYEKLIETFKEIISVLEISHISAAGLYYFAAKSKKIQLLLFPSIFHATSASIAPGVAGSE